jgi:hypothetical protein
MDFSTVLKIAQILTQAQGKKRVVVVCYMGASHTRALEDFFCKKMGFQRKSFHGKLDWDWGEAQKLHLPSSMWSLDGLFPKY